jgi:hypothetical protein
VAAVLDVVEVTALPSLDDEVGCEARDKPIEPGKPVCGATPVTHWLIFRCDRRCQVLRYALCLRHFAVCIASWPDGVGVCLGPGCTAHGRVEFVPAGGR